MTVYYWKYIYIGCDRNIYIYLCVYASEGNHPTLAIRLVWFGSVSIGSQSPYGATKVGPVYYIDYLALHRRGRQYIEYNLLTRSGQHQFQFLVRQVSCYNITTVDVDARSTCIPLIKIRNIALYICLLREIVVNMSC